MAVIKNLRRRVLLNKQIQQWQKDRGILLICLGIALSLWIPAKMALEYRIEKPIRLEITPPEGYAFLTLPPEDVSVVLEGKGWNLLYHSLFAKQNVVHIDAEQASAIRLDRAQFRKVVQDNLKLSKLHIFEMNYDELKLEFEPIYEKKVSVLFSGHLRFAQEFYFRDNLSMKPDSVTVKGPVSLVMPLEGVKTDSLIISDLSESIRKTVRVALAPPCTAIPPEVEIYVPVEQYTEKNLYVPVAVVVEKDSVWVFPTQVRIYFQVGLSRFNKVTSADFLVMAELPEERFPGKTQKAALKIISKPPYIRNLRLDTDSVDYFIVEDGK